MSLSQYYRRTIPIAIALIIAIITLLDYFIGGVPELKSVVSELTAWATIIVTIATIAASVNTTVLHTSIVTGRRPTLSGQKIDRYFSGAVIFLTIFYCILGFIQGTADPNSWYTWYYNTFYNPTSQTMALAGIAILLASYRGFKVRNVASLFFIISAVAMMFSLVPLGMAISPDFANFGAWLNSVINAAATRGILIGLGVAAVLWGIRVLMGKETGYLGATGG